jgi:hypothetical protein
MIFRMDKWTPDVNSYWERWILDTWTSNMWRKKEIADTYDALGEGRIDDVNGLLRSEKLLYKSWIDKYFKGNSLILHFVLNLK